MRYSNVPIANHSISSDVNDKMHRELGKTLPFLKGGKLNKNVKLKGVNLLLKKINGKNVINSN